MTPSLFKRVSSYGRGESRDERDLENRLTETVAAVLERDSHQAVAFAVAVIERARHRAPPGRPAVDACRGWLASYAAGAEAFIATQVARGGRFIDLEIRLTRDPLRRSRDLLLWIEVKHGSPLSGDQLRAYEHLVRVEPAEARLVVVIAPRDKPPIAEDVPPTIPNLAWQDVLTSYLLALPPQPPGSAGRLLRDELLAYFREENLLPATPLNAEHALALKHRTSASEVIRNLSRLLDERLRSDFELENRLGGPHPQFGPKYWSTYAMRPAADQWRGASFIWGFKTDSARRDSRNQYAFYAGAVFDRGISVRKRAGYEEWLADLASHRFEVAKEGGYWHVVDHMYPEELLAHQTFEGQADQLQAWVVAKFALLSRLLPPPEVSGA